MRSNDGRDTAGRPPGDEAGTTSRRRFLQIAGGGLLAAGVAARGDTARAARVPGTARLVIIGAGAGGIAMAARMARRMAPEQITLIDPRPEHLYQPGLSLVAAGLKPPSYVVSRTADWVPRGVMLIPEAAVEIDPLTRSVTTAGGQKIPYDFLVLAPGLVLDHAAIEGFSLDLVGRDGIGALYAGPEYAARTWQAAQGFIETGGIGLFTRPGTEMKCAGAPLKHTFLIDDLARRGPAPGRHQIHYMANAGALFSVPIVSEKVRMLYESRGIAAHYHHVLTAIDPGRKLARFATRGVDPVTGAEAATTTELPYDYIHVIPPMRAPDVVREAGLSWADRWTDQGWAEVDMKTLRHLRHPEIFAIGDVAGVPKGKTAASVKWQVPVVEDHLVAAMTTGGEGTAVYDGYTSCPLITRVGRAMLVEFDYHDNLTPSFPGMIAPLEELWVSWLMKEIALKPTYSAMLRGQA